jgi:hypothetical protein
MLEKHLSIRAADVDKRRAVSFADVYADTLTPRTAKARIMLLMSKDNATIDSTSYYCNNLEVNVPYLLYGMSIW